jgi:hypothetical protein
LTLAEFISHWMGLDNFGFYGVEMVVQGYKLSRLGLAGTAVGLAMSSRQSISPKSFVRLSLVWTYRPVQPVSTSSED